MADLTVSINGAPVPIYVQGVGLAEARVQAAIDEAVANLPAEFKGDTGDTGPAGTLTNNSGVVVTTPAGAIVAEAKTGVTITGGGGAAGADKGMVVDMTNGSLSGIDIQNAGTGYAMRFFDSTAGHLVTGFNDGNALITGAWIGIYAGMYTDTGVPGDANYNRIWHPPTKLPHMLGIHADVQLAEVVRGNNGANPMAKLFMLHDGKGYRLDMANGTIRFARADDAPFIGDLNTAGIELATFAANFSTYFPISIEPFNAGGQYGVQLKSYDSGTIGEMWLGVGSNGGICSAASGRVGLQNESGAVWQVGNAADGTVINGSQISSNGPLLLKSYTVAQLLAGTPSPEGHVGGIVYCSNGTGNKRLAVSDGTNWRFPDGAIVS